MFWIARTGSAWRDLPDKFGKWSSVYRRFRRWTLAGLWEAILEALNDGAARLDGIPPDRLQMVDSTIVRAHQHAAGAQGGSARQGVGRSRGGLTTKIHLRVNAWGLPMRADVTPGQTSDHRGFDLVMGDDLPAPAALLGDKDYDGDHIRTWAEAREAVPVIPMRRCRKAAGVSIAPSTRCATASSEPSAASSTAAALPPATTRPSPASSASSISPASADGSELSSTRPSAASPPAAPAAAICFSSPSSWRPLSFSGCRGESWSYVGSPAKFRNSIPRCSRSQRGSGRTPGGGTRRTGAPGGGGARHGPGGRRSAPSKR